MYQRLSQFERSKPRDPLSPCPAVFFKPVRLLSRLSHFKSSWLTRNKRPKSEDDARAVGLWTRLLGSVGAYFDMVHQKVNRLAKFQRLFDTKNYKKRLLEDARLLVETDTKGWTR